MAYTKTNWVDGEAGGTPISAENLNKLENGVAAADTAANAAKTWASITGKPSTFPPTIGTTATTAKAGDYAPPAASTSVAGVIQIGTGATQAAAGNHTQAATTVNVAADATNGVTAANLQVVISALAARVKALEDATP